MNPVSTIFAKTYHFGLKNVDTDVIILAAWLKTISRTGLVGTGFFFLLRQVMTSQLYDSVLRLLNFMVSLRRLPPLSELSGDEERMLFELRVLWEKQGALSVADVYGLGIKQSDSTSYRQLIALKNKGLLAISVAEVDKRRRDVSFTKTAEDLFSVIG